MAHGGGRDAAIVVETAPAKVNLYLHVLGRRPDGYHELDSLIVFADVADRIEASPARTLSLKVDGPFAPALAAPGDDDNDDNLMLRAARALAQSAGVAAGAALHLTKTLPVAAGIGGGSADAAATLRALMKLWRLAVDPVPLDRLALALGADVPVCLNGRPARVQGIGERLTTVAPPLPDFALVLANSGIGLSTPAVFGAREGPFGAPATLAGPFRHARDLALALGACRNDLEPAARLLAPEVGDVLDGLAGLPGARLARMSGSGATCFGLFDTMAQATAGAEILRRRQPGWWCAAAPVLGGG